MTIPAKYTLTEAHFRIAELEARVKELTEKLEHAHYECACAPGYTCGDHYYPGCDA